MIRGVTHNELVPPLQKVLPKWLLWSRKPNQEATTPQHQTGPSDKVNHEPMESPTITPANNPTPFPPQPSQIIFLVVEIIFGILLGCVFGNEIKEKKMK